MATKFEDDEYIANLLKEDAQNTAKTYALVGISAFDPKRPKSGAPKPNTNFLRHIIRQTDSHNAALLAKEADESSARLRLLNKDNKGKRHRREDQNRDGRLTPVSSSDDKDDLAFFMRSRKHNSNEVDHGHRQRGKERHHTRDTTPKAPRHRTNEVGRGEPQDYDKVRDRSSRRRRRDDSSQAYNRLQRRKSGESRHRQRGSSSGYRTKSRSRSPSRHSHKPRKTHRYRYRSRSPRGVRQASEVDVSSHRHADVTPKSRQRSISPSSDSDPLEAIVGPLPPRSEPPVRARGRGAHKMNIVDMDTEFSASYDPSTDVRFGDDAEDDWGDALEALQDRQRWKQQGAARLKAAGFTDAQVKKWEKGDEPNEEDVVWSRKGQAREWDRGKVVREDGDVEFKADFGRLK